MEGDAVTPLYMPHPGHFICAMDCQFFLNTYVNGYIVSTVGEYVPGFVRGKSYGARAKAGFTTLGAGADSFYETMVFPARRAERKPEHMCCPWEASDFAGIESARYATAVAATKGHADMVEKYGLAGYLR